MVHILSEPAELLEVSTHHRIWFVRLLRSAGVEATPLAIRSSLRVGCGNFRGGTSIGCGRLRFNVADTGGLGADITLGWGKIWTPRRH